MSKSGQDISIIIVRSLDLGLLIKNKSGELKQSETHLASPSGIPSRKLRDHHDQILRKAAGALDADPLPEREFSANTFAICASKIEEARRELAEFRLKFCRNLQENSSKDRVYC